MKSPSKKYGKSHNVNYHFDNYPNRKKDGRVKISLVVNLTGKKEYYPILPEAFMYRKFWKEAVDPETGQKLGHNFIQSRGNKDYESVFPVISEAKAEMETLIRKILRKKETLTHTVLRRRWNKESEVLHSYFLKYANEEVKRLEPSTYQGYLTMIRLVKKYDADVKLAEVTWEWIRDFQNWMLHEVWNRRKQKYGMAESTVSKNIWALGAIFRWAKLQGDIEEDPYYQYKGLRKRVQYNTPPPNPLSISEVIRLDEAYHNEELRNHQHFAPNGRRYDVGESWHCFLQQMLISIYTGVRFSDLKRFEDKKNFRILESPTGSRIYFRMKKSKRDHAILITERLRAVMVENEDGTFLKGKLLTSGNQNLKLRRILEHLGIDPNHRWHDLRATFANLVRDLSEDEFGASKAMGHAQLATTQEHYFNGSNPQGDKAVAALDKLGKATSDLPDPEDFIYEIKLLKALNPGMKLTPKVKNWLQKLANTKDEHEEGLVIPFGIAK